MALSGLELEIVRLLGKQNALKVVTRRVSQQAFRLRNILRWRKVDDLKAFQLDGVFIELILRGFIIPDELAASQMFSVTIQNYPHSTL